MGQYGSELDRWQVAFVEDRETSDARRDAGPARLWTSRYRQVVVPVDAYGSILAIVESRPSYTAGTVTSF